MRLFKKQYQVKPNTIGFLFRNHSLEKELNPGYYSTYDFKNRTALFCLPTSSRLISIRNQEVLTKDNIALRFSFKVFYKITDGEKFLTKFSFDNTTSDVYAQDPVNTMLCEAEQRLYTMAQVFIRNTISELDSETLNAKRNVLTDFNNAMEKQASDFGITTEQAHLVDLTFPKSIQNLFAKQLEAKIRAKSDLENARTAVATARALKNASELMKDDENIKFFQLIETITKIADKGKHTFMIGDIQQMIKT